MSTLHEQKLDVERQWKIEQRELSDIKSKLSRLKEERTKLMVDKEMMQRETHSDKARDLEKKLQEKEVKNFIF